MFYALTWEADNNRRFHDDVNLPASDRRARRDSHSRTNEGQVRDGPCGVLSPGSNTGACASPSLPARPRPPSSSGFSNLKPAAFPARAGAPAAGEGGAARQPTQSPRLAVRPGDVAAPRAHVQPRPAPARTGATACRWSRTAAAPGVQAAGPGGGLVLRAQRRSPGQTGREEAGWAGRTRFPGAGPGRGRGGAGPVFVALCQLR